MRKLLLAAAFLIGGSASAMAACSGPAVMHDFPGTSFNMSLATNAGDGNCSSNVTVISVPTTTVTGTITANAGTNLNTSLLALETGGNLASVVTNTNNLNLSIGSTTSGQKGNLVFGAVTTSAPTYTTAQSNALSLTTAGALRVDGSGVTQPVSISGNQAVNVAQINGVTPLMNNGTAGTGSPRVAISSDNTAIANWGHGATAATVPSGATLAGAQSGANMVALIQASASAAISVSTATTTQVVALSGSTKIYVTSFDVVSAGTGNITFVYGTGSSCGTGTTSLTGAYNFTAQSGIAKGNGLAPVLVVPAGNALCVTTSAAVQMSGSVSYTQF